METQESQLDLYKSFTDYRGKGLQILPDVGAAASVVRNTVYKDGALSRKVKRLIAMGIALGMGCAPCIIGQTKGAIEAGATKEEVLEAASVLLAVHGSTGHSESWRVVKVLEEMGKM